MVMAAGGGVRTAFGAAPVPAVLFITLYAVCSIIVVAAATGAGAGVHSITGILMLYTVFHVQSVMQVGEARAELKSKAVVAGSNVHPVLVLFWLNSTEIVDTTS